MSRLYVGKYSFSQRIINEWNKLSTVCVHSSTVSIFMNTIQKYFVRRLHIARYMLDCW